MESTERLEGRRLSVDLETVKIRIDDKNCRGCILHGANDTPPMCFGGLGQPSSTGLIAQIGEKTSSNDEKGSIWATKASDLGELLGQVEVI